MFWALFGMDWKGLNSIAVGGEDHGLNYNGKGSVKMKFGTGKHAPLSACLWSIEEGTPNWKQSDAFGLKRIVYISGSKQVGHQEILISREPVRRFKLLENIFFSGEA